MISPGIICSASRRQLPRLRLRSRGSTLEPPAESVSMRTYARTMWLSFPGVAIAGPGDSLRRSPAGAGYPARRPSHSGPGRDGIRGRGRPRDGGDRGDLREHGSGRPESPDHAGLRGDVVGPRGSRGPRRQLVHLRDVGLEAGRPADPDRGPRPGGRGSPRPVRRPHPAHRAAHRARPGDRPRRRPPPSPICSGPGRRSPRSSARPSHRSRRSRSRPIAAPPGASSASARRRRVAVPPLRTHRRVWASRHSVSRGGSAPARRDRAQRSSGAGCTPRAPCRIDRARRCRG